MNVKFKGIRNQLKQTGCSSCGSKRYSTGLLTSKTFFLPSGRRIDAEMNNTYHVSETDGEFLLAYDFFEEVES